MIPASPESTPANSSVPYAPTFVMALELVRLRLMVMTLAAGLLEAMLPVIVKLPPERLNAEAVALKVRLAMLRDMLFVLLVRVAPSKNREFPFTGNVSPLQFAAVPQLLSAPPPSHVWPRRLAGPKSRRMPVKAIVRNLQGGNRIAMLTK